MSRRLRVPTGPWVSLLVVMVAAGAVFTALSGQFLTTYNIYVILSTAALLAVVGFAQLSVLAVGEFSLAVGSIGPLAVVVAGNLMVVHHVPLAMGVLVCLAVGLACGLINGVLVARSGVGGFIITLATGGAFAGVTLAITRSQPYVNLPGALDDFGTGRAGFLPYIVLGSLLVAVLLAGLYRWHRTGRMMLAVGGNREAAELSGLSPVRAVIWSHALSGLLAAVAGLLAMAQEHQADPNIGTDWLIQSFTVAIIGGTALTGGVVSIGGVLVASVILGTISDGLVLLNVSASWVTFVQGVLVFAAVILGRDAAWHAYRRALARLRPSRVTKASTGHGR